MKTIDFKIDKDGVAILTIDVKDRPMNVMTPEFVDEIAECADRIASDEKIKGAVVTSGGLSLTSIVRIAMPSL